MIEITCGCAHDIASIMPIMHSAFEDQYGEAWNAAQCLGLLAMPGSQLLLAKKNDEVQGFALSRWVGNEEELLMIGVGQDHQRKGIGISILNQLVDIAIQRGVDVIFLEVREGNPAYQFYSASEFRIVGRRNNYYSGADGKLFNAITMRRDL